MRNRYPGSCYRCGGTVVAGDGHFERNGRGWRTQHASCAIKHRGTDLGKEGATEAREAARLTMLKKRALETGRRAQRARQELRQAQDTTPKEQSHD